MTHMAIGRLQVLSSFWLETTIPCHVGFSLGQLTTWQQLYLRPGQRTRESGPRQKPRSFWNLISEVISYPPTIFYESEAHKSGPCAREGSYTRMWKPGSRDHQGYCRGCLLCVCVCVCVHGHTCVWMYMYTHIHAYMHSHIHTCAYIHIIPTHLYIERIYASNV